MGNNIKKRVVVGERPAFVLPGWIIINAPRPIYGHAHWMGEFVTGKYYAAINPIAPDAEKLYELARKDDATVLAFIPEESAYARGREMLIEKYGASVPEIETILDDPDNRAWVVSRCVDTAQHAFDEGFPGID